MSGIESCGGINNVTFAVVCSIISLAIASVGYNLVGINDKLVKILSDPRNRLTKQEVRIVGWGGGAVG
jgi:hypothetical protein